MPNSDKNTDVLPQRLCGEIQLFDLCVLDSCTFKIGRFCTDTLLIGRFEKIAENELRVPERYLSEENDDENDGDGYDDEDTMEGVDGGEDDADWEVEE